MGWHARASSEMPDADGDRWRSRLRDAADCDGADLPAWSWPVGPGGGQHAFRSDRPMRPSLVGESWSTTRLRLGLVPATGRANNIPGVPPSSPTNSWRLPVLHCVRSAEHTSELQSLMRI